jgi:hypothetical protein
VNIDAPFLGFIIPVSLFMSNIFLQQPAELSFQVRMYSRKFHHPKTAHPQQPTAPSEF